MNDRHYPKHTGGIARPGSTIPDSSRIGELARNATIKTKDSLRILWYSNAPFTGTGYGVQTADVCQRLKEENHEVAIACNYGIAGSTSNWNGLKLYPQGNAMYSDDVLAAHYMDWTNNSNLTPLLITLFDVWPLNTQFLHTIPRILSWCPIDHVPIPPAVLRFLMSENVTPLAMSKFGHDLMLKAGLDALYAPHGVAPAFKPSESFNNIDGRSFMRVDDDAFVVMMNGANKGAVPCRKAFGENILAFSIFANDKPDAVLYMHCENRGSSGGIDLEALCRSVGLQPHQVKFVDQYAYRVGIPQELLATLYTAADVLLASSMGEGFGVPTIEAQACGTPVIVSNFSAQPELIGDGWMVDSQPWWNPMQEAWFCTPSVPDIVKALNEAYEAKIKHSTKAVKFAEQYAAETVFDKYWKPILKTFA